MQPQEKLQISPQLTRASFLVFVQGVSARKTAAAGAARVYDLKVFFFHMPCYALFIHLRITALP